MPDVTQGLAHAAPAAQRNFATGKVSQRRPAPSVFYDDLWVVLHGYSPDAPTGPCRWAAIHGASKPAQGAEVVVVFDADDRPIVTWWEGTHT